MSLQQIAVAARPSLLSAPPKPMDIAKFEGASFADTLASENMPTGNNSSAASAGSQSAADSGSSLLSLLQLQEQAASFSTSTNVGSTSDEVTGSSKSIADGETSVAAAQEPASIEGHSDEPAAALTPVTDGDASGTGADDSGKSGPKSDHTVASSSSDEDVSVASAQEPVSLGETSDGPMAAITPVTDDGETDESKSTASAADEFTASVSSLMSRGPSVAGTEEKLAMLLKQLGGEDSAK